MKVKKRILLSVSLLPFFLVAQNWEDTYSKALEKSSSENKPVILVFAGSDWCAPCKLLDKQIWQSDDFITYAEDNYVLYKADFPRKKANKLDEKKSLINNKLAEKFNQRGYFPLVIVLDKNEKVLGETGYKRKDPKAYITMLNSFIQ